MISKDTICKRCGHEWQRRTDYPRACPKCNSKKWDVETIIYKEKKKIIENNNTMRLHRPDGI